MFLVMYESTDGVNNKSATHGHIITALNKVSGLEREDRWMMIFGCIYHLLVTHIFRNSTFTEVHVRGPEPLVSFIISQECKGHVCVFL